MVSKLKFCYLNRITFFFYIYIGIRGGLTQASMRYAKPNNEKTPDFNPSDPKSWLVYQDCKFINNNYTVK